MYLFVCLPTRTVRMGRGFSTSPHAFKRIFLTCTGRGVVSPCQELITPYDEGDQTKFLRLDNVTVMS